MTTYSYEVQKMDSRGYTTVLGEYGTFLDASNFADEKRALSKGYGVERYLLIERVEREGSVVTDRYVFWKARY